MRRVVAILVTLFLFFGFLEELRAVDLKNLYFFLDVYDVLLDDLQCFPPLAFVFNLNLHKQVPFLGLSGEQNGLLEG